jgi:hypothetical protein
MYRAIGTEYTCPKLENNIYEQRVCVDREQNPAHQAGGCCADPCYCSRACILRIVLRFLPEAIAVNCHALFGTHI